MGKSRNVGCGMRTHGYTGEEAGWVPKGISSQVWHISHTVWRITTCLGPAPSGACALQSAGGCQGAIPGCFGTPDDMS